MSNITFIDENWDKLVMNTYGKPYYFQQQAGCRHKGSKFKLRIPSENTFDEDMNEEIPEIINGSIMGVKFKTWLARDPKQPVEGRTDSYLEMWWERYFYPDIHTIANDLYEQGLLKKGDYTIKISW